MSDDNLRRELTALGYTPGPITDSTRKVLKKKLEKLREAAKKSPYKSRSGENVRRSGHQVPADDSEDGDTPETGTSDRRRQSHRPYQPAKEREPWDTVQEGGSWRGGHSTRQEESNWRLESRADDGRTSAFSPHSEESTVWRRERASLLEDIPDRSSLGSTRYASDNLDRSSLGSTRYASDNLDRSSLGSTRYASDNLDRSSLGFTRYASDNLGYNRYAGDNSDRRSLGFSSNSSEELRHRPISDTSPVLDSLSYKTYASLKQEKLAHSKQAWSKKLEHYLSRLLRLLCVILVVVFTGILIVKSGILSTSQDNGMKLLPSECEGTGDPFCNAKKKEITLRILSELYDFLSLQAGSYECGNPSGLSSKCIPVNRAKEHVMNVSGFASDKFNAALDWMLSSDRHLGIWAKGEDHENLVTERADIFCVESSRPRLGFACRLKNALYTAISNLFLALLGIFILWIMLIFLRYHWQMLEEEEKQMFVMIEKIIDAVKDHYKNYTLGREQNPYVGILHVRDSLIVPQERKHLKRVWDRAVQFVEDNESRVRTELQRVAGADLRVWRWTQARNTYPR